MFAVCAWTQIAVLMKICLPQEQKLSVREQKLSVIHIQIDPTVLTSFFVKLLFFSVANKTRT
jgi:hypothetical protein